MAVTLFCFIAFYLFFFRLSYFRHDDWLILGNALLRLPNDWSFAFRPTLYFNGTEYTWFFRPLFKTFVYGFFELFAFQYELWLFALMLFVIGSIWLGSRLVWRLTESKEAALLFTIIFVSSIHFHFGSLVWMGEGMMNSPQLFLILLALFLYCNALRSPSPRLFSTPYLGATMAYLLALGFKESSVLIFPLCFLLTWMEPRFSSRSITERVKFLLPLFVLTVAFLCFRLLYLPVNPQYLPSSEIPWVQIAQRVGIFLACLIIPTGAIALLLSRNRPTQVKSYLSALLKYWPYSSVLVVYMLPFVAVPFFSTGWLLLYGAICSLVLALAWGRVPAAIPTRAHYFMGVGLFVLSLIPVLFKLDSLGWWQWKQGQVQIQQIISQAKDKEKLTIYACANTQYPESTVNRVVSFEQGLFELWSIYHGEPTNVSIQHCSNERKRQATLNELRLRWQFPKFSFVDAPS